MKPNVVFLLVGALLLSGCVHRRPARESGPQDVVVVQPQEGTEQHCWQEPKVIDEKNGPGVDEKGHWYHAPHTAVREVKQGRWKKCPESR